MTEKGTGWTSGGFDDELDETQGGTTEPGEDPTVRLEPQGSYDDGGNGRRDAAGDDTPVEGQTRESLVTAVQDRTHDRSAPPTVGGYPTTMGAGATDEDDEGYEEEGPSSEGGFLDGLYERLGSPMVIAIAGIVLLAFLAYLFLGRGGGESADSGDGGQGGANGTPGEAAPSAAPELPPVRDTGIVLEQPQQKDGAYLLEAGQIAWRGKTEKTDDGEVLSLEGATNAEFRRVALEELEIDEGSLMTGTFGRAEPGQPWLHGMFDRTIVGGVETTEGTYKLGEGDRILLVGTYSDQREGGEIVRTYSERPPASPPSEAEIQRVRFEAPVGVPIPVLLGREPSPLEEAR